jgi:Tfp pilus assembly protein PilF
MKVVVFWKFVLFSLYTLQILLPEALADLDNAIELSAGKGKSASQAHNQRALIYRLRGDNERAKVKYWTYIQH